MPKRTELWVERNRLRETRVVTGSVPTPGDGEVAVAIDKFALTANNVSYAIAGDTIGYWGYYPADDRWGKVPAWGCATVVASRCEEIPVGETLYGFFPMASHACLAPGKFHPDHFMDIAPHRSGLPSLYNVYRRTGAEPRFLTEMETERCLFFPLLITSYLLKDYLTDHACFGAQQVIIGSVSSKTGTGLAAMLRGEPGDRPRIVGLTSPGNRAYVDEMGCCDRVFCYGEEDQLDLSLPATYVDMAGDAGLTRAVHERLRDNMVASISVGATHWEQRGNLRDVPGLPGASPVFFFAQAHVARRDAQWGPGVIMSRAAQASAETARRMRQHTVVEWVDSAAGLAAQWRDLLDNRVSPARGLMVSLVS
jgi:hypothetical protein